VIVLLPTRASSTGHTTIEKDPGTAAKNQLGVRKVASAVP
jgi:hypothetical protein